jgi:urease accessory protein
MGRQAHSELHPPLQEEGRTAEGSPGWGGGDAAHAEALSPPPGPLARADLPPSGGGDRRGYVIGKGAALEEEAKRTTFAANRAVGRVCFGVAATPTGTRRTTTREEGSLRVRLPNACAAAPEAVLVNTAGGIAGGDRFAVDLALDTGARLTVTTAAAEKIYRSLGPDACLDVCATLKDGAELTWLPQETILFDRARLARTVTIALAPSAKLLLAETIVFGRSAMGETVREGRVIDRWRVRRDGRLIFAENFRLDGPVTDRLNEAAVAGGCTAIGTVLVVPGDDAAVAAVRAAYAQFRGEAGISAWNGIALARLAARDGAALRHDLVVLLSALGRCALPRIWLN